MKAGDSDRGKGNGPEGEDDRKACGREGKSKETEQKIDMSLYYCH